MLLRVLNGSIAKVPDNVLKQHPYNLGPTAGLRSFRICQWAPDPEDDNSVASQVAEEKNSGKAAKNRKQKEKEDKKDKKDKKKSSKKKKRKEETDAQRQKRLAKEAAKKEKQEQKIKQREMEKERNKAYQEKVRDAKKASPGQPLSHGMFPTL